MRRRMSMGTDLEAFGSHAIALQVAAEMLAKYTGMTQEECLRKILKEARSRYLKLSTAELKKLLENNLEILRSSR